VVVLARVSSGQVKERGRVFVWSLQSPRPPKRALLSFSMSQRCWGKSIASTIQTPLAANLERLLYGIVSAAVTDCFATITTQKMNADETQAFVALCAEWATPEAAQALLFNEGKLQELSKLMSSYSASMASLAEVLSKCTAAIKGLQFHFQPGDELGDV
jgi:hypothetical protein